MAVSSAPAGQALGAAKRAAVDQDFLLSLRQALFQLNGRDPETVSLSDSIADLGLDSIEMSELVVMLEDRYNVTLEREDLEGVATFADLEELVARKRA